MTTSNRILRQLEEQKQQDLASLELLSRDLDVYLKGPKEVKVKAAPKYVTGVTKSQGDEEYASNIKAFGSKQLARAFGMNMGMSAIQQSVLNELEGKYGSGEGTREFVDLATQVVCHLLMQAAIHAENGADAKAALPVVKSVLMYQLQERNSIGAALDYLNGLVSARTGLAKYATGSGTSTKFLFDPNATVADVQKAHKLVSGKVYQWLRPLNLVHIERVDARYSPRISSRDVMLDYILNAEAQRSVTTYMLKHAVPDDVLLPAALSDAGTGRPASTRADVLNVFSRYPSKDVAATYAYYNKAVKENLDTKLGIQTGDVRAYLEGAATALRDASKSLSTTGISASVRTIFSKGFTEAASALSRISPTSNEADEEIAFIVADLADLLGAFENIGSGGTPATARISNRLDNAMSAKLEVAVTKILQATPSRYEGRGSFSETSIEYLDARSEICPADVDATERVNPRFKAVVQDLAVAFINMDGAYNVLLPVGGVSSRPVGTTEGRLQVTEDFSKLVVSELTKFQTYADTVGTTAVSGAAFTVYKDAIFEAYEQILGATGFDRTLGVGSTGIQNLTTAPALSSSAPYSITNWEVSASRLNEIANGTAPTFRDSGLEQILIDLVNRNGRALKTAKERRTVRDLSLRVAKMLSDTVESLHVQAQNTGIAVQIRRNPAMSKGQMALTGTGSLVGTHAVSAIANRVLQPGSGSMKAHLADYGPSLAVAGYGIYKANQGEKDLGYSLAGGAVAHMGLRYLFSCCPSLRFSENPVLKALQAPTNGLAHLIGDESMAASALTPASIEGKDGDALVSYLVNLVNANDCDSLGYIACQLYKSGLRVVDTDGEKPYGTPDGDLIFTFEDASADVNPLACCKLACALTMLKCVVDVYGLAVVSKSAFLSGDLTFRGKLEDVKLSDAAHSDVCKQRLAACKENMSKILNVPVAELSGFILEPGYNMNVYSGEDQVSYLQPAPQQTSQSGFVQLEDAIARARQLGPQEKLQEGIADLQDVAIIRANPNMARDIEAVGMGTSLGRSRTNPGQELVALEVEGANGLWPIAPARQQSVPQGALNYAKIGHASDVTVSPEGLFNRGAFKPMFGR